MKNPDKGDVFYIWFLLIVILGAFAFFKWWFWSITNEGFWYYYTEPVFKGLGIIALVAYLIFAGIQTVKYLRTRRRKANEKA